MKAINRRNRRLFSVMYSMAAALVILASWGSADEASSQPVPVEFHLGKNAPDPFCSRDTSTCIDFELPRPADVRFSILDYETNDTLRILLNGSHGAGSYMVCWDGRDSIGSLVPGGFYAYRLTVSVEGSVVFDSSGVATQCCGDDCYFSEVATPLISFPSTTVGDTSAATLILRNPFDQSITLKASSVAEQAISFSSDFEESLLDGITIDPDSSVSTDAFFCPLKEGVHKKDVFFESVDTGDTLALTHLRGEGRAIAYEWTSANQYPDRIVGINDTLMILETMDDFIEVDSLILHYAIGGSAEYERMKVDLIFDDPMNDRYLAMLPAKEGESRGLNFYVAAHNGPVVACSPSPESPEHVRIRVENLTFPRATNAMKYQMVSIPIDVLNNTIVGILDDDLGGRNVAEWRMFTYVPSDSRYVELPNDSAYSLIQGAGYWLITKDAATLDTAPLQAISTSLDSSFAIRVEPGWNMIGNPFDFRVAWDSIMVDELPIAMADTSIESPVGWDIDQGYRYNLDILDPFQGYWVKNLDTLSHMLRIPPKEDQAEERRRVSKALAKAPFEGRKNGWIVELRACGGGAKDESNFIGVIGGARNQWDRNDLSEPPLSPDPAISLYFPHSSWERHAGLFASDMRGECEPSRARDLGVLSAHEELLGHAWHFDVAKSFSNEVIGDAVTIEFAGIESVPADAAIYLIDRHLQRLIDLRAESTYCFLLGRRNFVSNEEDARFALLIGNEAFMESRESDIPDLPSSTMIHQNYPNPFNPSTVIRYDIAKAGDAELIIFDAQGSLVRTLYHGLQKPGRYELIWNGENNRGFKVASGIYFCRLKTERLARTKKLILLR